VNEVVDRVGEVVVAAARRRTARRRVRAVAVTVAAGMLLAASGASAVTGVGPLGAAFDQDEELPLGAKPTPGGESVRLTAETEDGHRHVVRAYRLARRQAEGWPGGPNGPNDYCVGSLSKDPRGRAAGTSIVCTQGDKIAGKLLERRMWLPCSSRGGVSGRPVPADPVCGLTLGDTTSVTIDPDRGGAGQVQLSRPFRMRRGGGKEALSVRAILGVVEAPATQPGDHTPRVAVTATGADGSEATIRVGGRRVPTAEDFPSMDPTPEPGGPRHTLTAGGWTAKAWRTASNDHCAASEPASGPVPRDPSIFCMWAPEVGRFRSLVLGETVSMFTRVRPAPEGGYAVYGLVRANARGVEVRDPAGRVTAAELSAPWTTIRRRKGDLLPIPPRFRDRFRGIPRSLRVRVFQAVVASPPVPDNGRHLVIRTELPGGRVVESRPYRTPRKGTTSLTITPPPIP
jgi:hypothetical protein